MSFSLWQIEGRIPSEQSSRLACLDPDSLTHTRRAAEGFSYNGLLSDVVIYDRVLSTNEVLQLATRPPLTITNQPASVSVSTGGTATFSVGVTGSSPFSCQWALNGTNISGATNAFLTLTNVSSAKVGVYTVTVTNSFWGRINTIGEYWTIKHCGAYPGIHRSRWGVFLLPSRSGADQWAGCLHGDSNQRQHHDFSVA